MKKILITCISFIILCAGFTAAADAGQVVLDLENDTAYDWIGFHFFIFEFQDEAHNPLFNYNITNVSFIDNPSTSQSPNMWEISSDGKELDLFFSSDPVKPGDSASFEVRIENHDRALYGVGFNPVVVPEPVSSTLFLVGAAALGFRRFRRSV